MDVPTVLALRLAVANLSAMTGSYSGLCGGRCEDG